jgi:apolipoprotein N-acyltransferase
MPASKSASDRCPGIVIAGLAIAHAILFGLAYPTVGLWPLIFVAAAPLVWLVVACPGSNRRVMLPVFGAQLVMWLCLNAFLIDVTFVGYVLLAFYMSGYVIGFMWLLRSIHRVFRWPAALLAPVVWVGVEFARGELVFNGYPWFLAAHPAIEWPLLVQSVDLLGMYFVSFSVVMVSGLVVDVLRYRSGALPRRALVIAGAATVGVHAANLLYGVARIDPVPAEGPVVLAIQTNLPQDNKLGWTAQQQVQDIGLFVDLTLDAAQNAPVKPALVLWPETMLPGFGLEPETIRASVEYGLVEPELFALTIADLAERLDVPMLVGSPSFLGMRIEDRQWAWDTHYNSAYLVNSASGPYARYDKSFLTPFGETMPYISVWPWLESKLMAMGAGGMSFDMDANPDSTLFEVPWRDGTLRLATPICFEITMARVCRRMVYAEGVKAADVIINLSNDGWFGSSDAGRRRHVQMARFRCIENRVPMIRSVNTGMSLAVDSSGRLIGPMDVTGSGPAAALREPGWVLAELPLDPRSTVYGRIGDAWGWVCLLATSGLWVAAVVLHRREATK